MRKAIVDTNILLRLLVKDDDAQRKACERLLAKAKEKEILLYVLPVSILEIVWVLEKYYKLERAAIRELVEAILNTPELKCEMDAMLKKAIEVYEEKNIKFADAVIGRWGIEKGISEVFTYDEKDFRRIEGLKVHKP